MAHAGTPTDLAKQPATSTNGLWQTAAAAIVLLALVVGMIIVTSSLLAASKSSVAPAFDHRYDQVDNLAANMRGAAPALTTDRSYDAIENQRSFVQVYGLTNDRSFDKIQSESGAAGLDKVVGHRGAMILQ
jgi:hypothetical protein